MREFEAKMLEDFYSFILNHEIIREIISALDIWLTGLLILVFVGYVFGAHVYKKEPQKLAYVAVSLVVTMVLIHILKLAFSAPRPSLYVSGEVLYDSYVRYLGFPSMHSGFVIALAESVRMFDKHSDKFGWVLAGVVIFSRIAGGAHVFSDVLVGGLVGFFVAKTLYRYGKKWIS